MHLESIHSTSLFPQYPMLRPYSQIDSIYLLPQNSTRNTPYWQSETSLFETFANLLQRLNKYSLSVDLRDRIVLRHRSGEGYRRNAAPLKIPVSTVAFNICKWKKFRTTRTLPRAGRPSTLSDRGRRAFVMEGPRTRWSLWQSSSITLCREENVPEGQPFLQHSTIRPVW